MTPGVADMIQYIILDSSAASGFLAGARVTGEGGWRAVHTELTTEPLPSPGTGALPGQLLPVTASVLAHAALLAAILLNWADAPAAGGGGVVLEAISIEVVDGAAFDALRDAAAPRASAGSLASVIDSEGGLSAAAAVPAPAAPAEPTPETPPEPRPNREEAQPAPETQAALQVQAQIDTPPLAMPSEPPRLEVVDPVPPETPPTPAAPTAASAAAEGGAASRASEAREERPARAGASPGDVNRYTLSVIRALNSAVVKRLAGGGRRGQLLLVFTIGEDGDVTDVEIKQTSGNAALDSHAVRLVREANFPEPPQRMSAAQRTYAVPIRVK